MCRECTLRLISVTPTGMFHLACAAAGVSAQAGTLAAKLASMRPATVISFFNSISPVSNV